jgi:rubrerythrin
MDVSMNEPEVALAVIRRAMQNEIAGQRFYSDAAFYCIDPWAKDVFANLAQEEERHTHLLLVEYQSLEARGQWVDPEIALQAHVDIDITGVSFLDDDPAEELFPPEWTVGEAVDRRADDLAALSFGIQMEQRAIALYRQEAAENTDPAAQQAYQFLLEDEMRHHVQLKEQWERLAGIPFPGE